MQTFINAHRLTSINTRTQLYSYEHLPETEPADPRDRQSQHRHLAINEHVTYR